MRSEHAEARCARTPFGWVGLAVALAVLLVGSVPQVLRAQPTPDPAWLEPYREPAARLIGAALADRFAWRRLADLTDTIGHRLSGSPQLDRAIAWALDEMRRDGLENVRAEKVMVPRWVRGRERAQIVEPGPHAIAMLGLGDSIATPHGGLTAEVLVIRHFAELADKAAQAKGRIVVVNAPFTTYDESVSVRTGGASRAARYGAVAVLVRSIGPAGQRLPHTGALQYHADVPKIPAAAISTEDADRLQRLSDQGARIVVHLDMEAHFEGEVASANVVGEIRGAERPEEIVVVGGHLDSWDVGSGASDDGGGCVVTWEALRLMKKLGLRPRRTVRVVLWTNEENGGRGALAYRDDHRSELSKHVAMLESDIGVFKPTGFGFSGTDRARRQVRVIASLLAGIGADHVGAVGGGADIGPSVEAGRIPALSLEVDGPYFAIHHTEADTVDKIDPFEMAKCAAAVAVMTYVIADLPHRLGE